MAEDYKDMSVVGGEIFNGRYKPACDAKLQARYIPDPRVDTSMTSRKEMR